MPSCRPNYDEKYLVRGPNRKGQFHWVFLDSRRKEARKAFTSWNTAGEAADAALEDKARRVAHIQSIPIEFPRATPGSERSEDSSENNGALEEAEQS